MKVQKINMRNKISTLILISVITAVLPNCVATLPLRPSISSNTPVTTITSQATATPLSPISPVPTPNTPTTSLTPAPVITPQVQPSPTSSPQVISSLPESTVAITTLSGNFVSDSANADINVEFQRPSGIAVDSFGNVYVADTLNHKIRKIQPAGRIVNVAGSFEGMVDQVASKAEFSGPSAITVDSKNNLYISDTKNNRIRKISFEGNVTTFAGNQAGMEDAVLSRARFNQPAGITIDEEGNFYVADSKNSAIRKINSFKVTTLAGGTTSGHNDGIGIEAKFSSPHGITRDYKHNLYVADSENHVIRKISPEGNVTTLAGSVKNPGFSDGTGSAAHFDTPTGITYSYTGYLYVADTANNRIRRIDQNGVVTTVTGTIAGYRDGTAGKALFSRPIGIASDLKGNLFIADSENNRIRKITFN